MILSDLIFFFFFFGGGGVTLIFFLHILSSLVNVRLHTENWLCNLAGSALKVPVVGGGWWVVVESKHSDQLWLSFSLALAKPNKINYHFLLGYSTP